jgi:hypothetical protein
MGAGRGIGRGIAVELAKLGQAVVDESPEHKASVAEFFTRLRTPVTRRSTLALSSSWCARHRARLFEQPPEVGIALRFARVVKAGTGCQPQAHQLEIDLLTLLRRHRSSEDRDGPATMVGLSLSAMTVCG